MAANFTTLSSETTYFDLQAFYATLISCFISLLSGYATVKLKLLSNSDLKGLKFFLLYFLTPAVLMNCLLKVHVSDVSWTLVACLFTAKTLIFVISASATMILSKNAAKSGLYGILATQSNDLALGVPLVSALYGSNASTYLEYLYLAIPFILVFNTIGFGLIEVQKSLDSESGQERKSLCLSVFKGLIKNPLLIAILLGIGGNLLSNQFPLPLTIRHTLDDWASTFPTVALFTLGTSVARQGPQLGKQFHAATPIMMVLVKILLLPILIRVLCSFLPVGRSPLEHELLSDFAFLYGCLPSAPSVFVYAYYADVAVEQISTSLTLGTFMSAPWLLMTANMISAAHTDPANIQALLSTVNLDVAVVSGLFAIITILSILIGSKRWSLPRLLVYGYAGSLVVISGGVFVAPSFAPVSNQTFTTQFLSTLFVATADCSMWLWALVLIIAVHIIRARSLCYLIRTKYRWISLAVVLPMVQSLIRFAMFDSKWLQISILSITLFACIYLLVAQQNQQQRVTTTSDSSQLIKYQATESTDTKNNENKATNSLADSWQERNVIPDIEEMVPMDPEHEGLEAPAEGDRQTLLNGKLGNSEELRLCAKSTYCRGRARCRALLAQYDRQNGDSQNDNNVDIDRCVTLTCIVCVAMVVRLFCLIWAQIGNDQSAILRQMQILDVLLSRGQGVILWLIFGVRLDQFTDRLSRFYRAWRYGNETLRVPEYQDLDAKTKEVCYGFCANHLQRCQIQLAVETRMHRKRHSALAQITTSNDVIFTGQLFVDWLIRQQLANDRAAAEKYARRLVLGQVITHVAYREHFHDSNILLYKIDRAAALKHAAKPKPEAGSAGEKVETEVEKSEADKNGEQSIGNLVKIDSDIDDD